MSKKFIVVGLDGANWDLINPWLDELPNISKMKKNGCWGDMKSCLPAVTFPNWKCYSTGKNPGKLGVFWFEKLDIKNRNFEIPNSRSFDGPEVWDYLNEKGIKTAIINMPSTFPPKRVDGYMIAGGPDAEYTVEKNYTYPKNLSKRLKEDFNYKVHPDKILTSKDGSKEEVEEILQLIETRFEVALELLSEVDFVHVTIYYLNVLQHYFFRDEPTKRAWKIVDKYLGKLSERGDMMVMSDHGCNEIDEVFFVNTWLENEGYLKTNKVAGDYLVKIGLTQQNFYNLFKFLGAGKFINRVLQKIVPESVRDMVPEGRGFDGGVKRDKINWDKTVAIANGEGLIYLNIDKSNPDYEKTRDEIIGKIENLGVAANVYKSEEVYSGPYLKKAPDIIFEPRPGLRANTSVGKEEVFGAPKKWSAENMLTGFFLAYGPSFKKGVKVEDVNIVDLAPTVLHLHNMGIPEDMDGKVLRIKS